MKTGCKCISNLATLTHQTAIQTRICWHVVGYESWQSKLTVMIWGCSKIVLGQVWTNIKRTYAWTFILNIVSRQLERPLVGVGENMWKQKNTNPSLPKQFHKISTSMFNSHFKGGRNCPRKSRTWHHQWAPKWDVLPGPILCWFSKKRISQVMTSIVYKKCVFKCIYWIWPPPCNSGKWRLIGIPY